MANYMGIEEASKRFGISKRRVRQMCTTGKLPGARKVNGQWKIPATADARLRGNESLPINVEASEVARFSKKQLEAAARKVGIVKDCEKFAAAYVRNGGKWSDGVAVYASKQGISRTTIYRWRQKYKGRDVGSLVDTRGRYLSGFYTISPEAFEVFKSMYLTSQQQSIKTCWLNVTYINKSESRGWVLPSYQALCDYVKKNIPIPVAVLHREGLAAYEAKCSPYVQVDLSSVQPGEIWVGDHHQFNAWIRHRNRWVRPWITAWMDMRSRALVGWFITISPNQTTIMLAMKRAIDKYGPPESVKIDNGKDYDSEMWTGTTKAKRKAVKAGYIDEGMVVGIYSMMDIGVSFSIKYHPQSKSIERFFDTIDRQFVKSFATYCGKDTDRKPENLNALLKSDKAIKEGETLESFSKLFDRYACAYNTSIHTGQGMDGRTPAEVIGTRQTRRVMFDGVLDLLMRVWSGPLKVGKNGVRFKNMWYGQFNPELLSRFKKPVRVAYDPDDIRRVDVYDAATLKFITFAKQNRLIQYGSQVSEEHLREAMRQKQRALKINKEFRNSRLTANMDLVDLTIRALQDAAKPDTQHTEVAARLKPVKTPLDGQLRDYKRREIIEAIKPKIAKKAVGAEGTGILDLDFSLLLPRTKNKRKELDLLGGFLNGQ